MQEYVVEARDDQGRLDFTAERPPFAVATENMLFDYYFDHGTENDDAEWSDVVKWFASKGWVIRVKTW